MGIGGEIAQPLAIEAGQASFRVPDLIAYLEGETRRRRQIFDAAPAVEDVSPDQRHCGIIGRDDLVNARSARKADHPVIGRLERAVGVERRVRRGDERDQQDRDIADGAAQGGM